LSRAEIVAIAVAEIKQSRSLALSIFFSPCLVY
jgi:hypothetical protein